MTAVPALTAVLLKHRQVEEKDPAFLIWLRTRYLAALRVALRYPFGPPLVGAGGAGGGGARWSPGWAPSSCPR